MNQVAFYYAFIQCYSIFLIIPTICGTLTWLFSGPYSSAFAVFTCLWGIVFVEYWKRQEIDLSIRWDVRGVGGIKVNRPQYVWEREEVDSVTGELKRVFPTHKRILRQLWFLPFAALAGVVLGTVLLVTFALEALMSDVYGSVLEDRWVCAMSQNNIQDRGCVLTTAHSICNTCPPSFSPWLYHTYLQASPILQRN